MSLKRYSLRSLQLRPGRTLLTMLSIVIGVAAVVAVTLLTATTRGAYRQMFATVTGKASLEIDSPGGAGFDEALLPKVAELPGVAAAVPLLKRPSSISLEGRRVRVQIMGIDPALDSAVRDYDLVAGVPLGKTDGLVMDEEFAAHLGLKLGDEVFLLTRRPRKPFKIVGLVRPRGGEVLRQAAMAFMPIERAQYYFNPRGRSKLIDAIQIVTDSDAPRENVAAAISALLPQEVTVHEPASSTQLMRETLLSSEKGLTLTTLFTLLLATFIILNTLLMSVGERRRHLAIMRAIGATRGQLATAVIGESLVLGIAGSVLGVAAGIAGAWLSNRTLAQALEVTLPPVSDVFTWQPLVLGPLFGIAMAAIGAIIPAMRVWRVSPLEGMSRVAPAAPHRGWFFVALGALLVAAGWALVLAGAAGRLPVEAPMVGGVAILAGCVFLEVAILKPQAMLVAWVLQRFMPIETRLALQQILRHNTRSALTVGVLFAAGAAGIGMANSILDNVNDVRDWYEQAIVGDYFIRAMMPDMSSGAAPDLPDGMLETIEQQLGNRLESLEGAAFLDIRIPGPDDDPSAGQSAICIARGFEHPDPPYFDLVEGDRLRLRAQLHAGEVILGSVLAQRLKLKVGDELPIETREGVKTFPVAAVTNEYMVGGLAVYMQRGYAERYLGVEGYDGIIVRAKAGQAPALKEPLEAICTRYDVLLHSYADISTNVNRMVRGIEGSLWLLVYLGFVVGAFGVVNTLSMNVLEQTRELGLLRIVAMTKGQVWRTILGQALLIGGVGLPPGIACGVINAWMMNRSMERTFGHPVEFQVHPWLLLGTLAGAMLIVVAAALVPARRAARINAVEALHYE